MATVNTSQIAKAVGYVGYFGASSVVTNVFWAAVRTSNPLFKIAGYIGGVGVGMAVGNVAKDQLTTTIEKL